MKRLEVVRNLAGLNRSGGYTVNPKYWIEKKPSVHNILLVEVDDDASEGTTIVDINVPLPYTVIADLLETTLATGIGFGILHTG